MIYNILTGTFSDRNCFVCGTAICECMGYTRAGDLLEFLEREKYPGRAIFKVREMCGLCIERCELVVQGRWPTSTKEFDGLLEKTAAGLGRKYDDNLSND